MRSSRLFYRARFCEQDLAQWMNPLMRGRMNYYGRYYRLQVYRCSGASTIVLEPPGAVGGLDQLAAFVVSGHGRVVIPQYRSPGGFPPARPESHRPHTPCNDAQ